MKKWFDNIYFYGNRCGNEIAITFDDGPSTETLEILSILRKYNIKATFFLVGKMIKENQNIVNIIKNDGHCFGNHTFSHKRLWFKSKKFIEKEILDCDNELEKFGIKTDLVRFPGLKFGINALIVCKKLNKKIIFTEMISWNPFVYDWFYPWLKKIGFNFKLNTDIITDQTVKNTKSGSILVFHDYLQEIGPNNDSALIIGKILPELKNRGFKFVTLENASFLFQKN